MIKSEEEETEEEEIYSDEEEKNAVMSLESQWEENCIFFDDDLYFNILKRKGYLDTESKKRRKLLFEKKFLPIYIKCYPDDDMHYYKVFPFYQSISHLINVSHEKQEIIDFIKLFMNLNTEEIFNLLDRYKRNDLKQLIHDFNGKIARVIRIKHLMKVLLYFIILFDLPSLAKNFFVNHPSRGYTGPNFSTTNIFTSMKNFRIAFGEYCDEFQKHYAEKNSSSCSRSKCYTCSGCGAAIKISIRSDGSVRVIKNTPHSIDCQNMDPFLPEEYIDHVAQRLIDKEGTVSPEKLQAQFHTFLSRYRAQKSIERINPQKIEEDTWTKIPGLLNNIEVAGGTTSIEIEDEIIIKAGFVTKWGSMFLQSRSFPRLLFIDGQFNISNVHGVYMQVSSVTPTNKVFPIAASWMRTESTECVEAVLQPIIDSFPEIVSMQVYIIADEGKAIKAAIEQLLPNAQLRNCAWHISIKLIGTNLYDSFWQFVKSSNEESKRAIKEFMKEKNSELYSTFLEKKLENVVNKSVDKTLGFISSSIAESANAMLLPYKHKPPFEFFVGFIQKQYTLLVEFNKELENENRPITNYAWELLSFSKEKSIDDKRIELKTKNPELMLAIVIDKVDNKNYMVNKHKLCCSCNRSNRGIPCSHLLAALQNQVHDYELVAEHFRTEFFNDFVQSALNEAIPDLTDIVEEDAHAPGNDDARASKKRHRMHGFI